MTTAIMVITAFLLVFSFTFFTRAAQERRVEQARRKRSNKARSYQKLMTDLPDVIWTQEIYEQSFNF